MTDTKTGWRELAAAQKTKKKTRKRPDDPEHRAQCGIVEVMRLTQIPHAASLNGVRLPPGLAGKAKAAGMTAGEPDFRIDGHPLRPELATLALAAVRLRGVAGKFAEGPQARQLEAVADWLAVGAPSAVFVELKADDVAKRNRLTDPEAGASDVQRARMAEIRQVSGAECFVAYGMDDCLRKMGELGFAVRGCL
jgi:hypothetical protein